MLFGNHCRPLPRQSFLLPPFASDHRHTLYSTVIQPVEHDSGVIFSIEQLQVAHAAFDSRLSEELAD